MRTKQLLLWVGLYFGFVSLAFAQEYTIKPAPTLGGTRYYAQPFGFNDLNQIAGGSAVTKTNNAQHAYLWTKKEGILDLGTLGGTYSYATAVNDSSEVAGVSRVSGDVAIHPFLWTGPEAMQDLGALPGDDICIANGLNSSAQVAGTCWLTTNVKTQRAFLWSSSVGMQELGALAGELSVANGISNSGQVVGWFFAEDGSQHSFLWTAEGGVQDLGKNSGAISINNLGQVVGAANFSSGFHAFLWSVQTGMQDLGSLGGISTASAINDKAHIVGFFRPSSIDTQRAFVWTPKDGMQDLNQLIGSKLSQPLVEASAISAAGQILAGQSDNFTFVLTPKMTTTMTSSPNPSLAGEGVTFTATVGHSIQGPPPDGERVRFKDGNIVIGIGTLSNGVATFSTSKLNVGPHSIVAVYAGNSVYASSKSSAVQQVVGK
jgi:probable HAF family extracellular repeat protein